MARSDFRFSHRIRVRWSEVDPQAIVFNARYLDYADVAVTEYWRAVRASDLWTLGQLSFHVARATVNYRRPIVADEEVDLLVRTAAIGRSSVTTLVELHGARADDLRAEIELVTVHVDVATHRSQPLPEGYEAGLRAFDMVD